MRPEKVEEEITVNEKVRAKAVRAIESKLANSGVNRENQYWDCCRAEFTFGNNRKAVIRKHMPNKKTNKSNQAGIHFSIRSIDGRTTSHLTLEEVAEKLYELGLENVDPLKDGVNTKKLRELGFRQIETLQEPNIKDIGFMLEDGFYQYRLELDESQTYCGQNYSTGDSPYYYGSTYRDLFHREYLCVRHSEEDDWKRVLYRDVKIGSQCVSNYVGD